MLISMITLVPFTKILLWIS